MSKWYEDVVGSGVMKHKYLSEGEDVHSFINRVSSIYSKDIREEVKEALYNGDFFQAGRTLFSAGKKNKGEKLTNSNCFIQSLEDDTLEAISELDYKVARIGSMGGGIGFSVDKVRPKGSKINNAAKVSTGVAFVMKKINQTGQIVGQHGRGK